jgi:hypothetical protein
VKQNANQNTRRRYESGWNAFQKYLADEGIEKNTIRACDIADYLRQRMEVDGVAAATLAGDRVAIGDALKFTPLAGLHLDPIVSDTLKVCMNRAAQSKPKQHVSAELMMAIASMQNEQNMDWIALRNYAMMLLMMVGMLRESEAVELTLEDVRCNASEAQSSATAAAAYSGSAAWLQSQQTSVSLYAAAHYPLGSLSSLDLLIRQSKTDQAKKGHVVPLSANREQPLLCPVRALQRYVSARVKAGVFSNRLFCKKDGAAMASTTPCGIVQAMVRTANEQAERLEGVTEKWGPPAAYGSHSMRRGGVTEARRSGVSMLDIKQHGRWGSNAVFGYVGPTKDQQLAVTKNIFGAAAAGAGTSTRSAPNTPVKPKEPFYATADEHGQYDHESARQRTNRLKAIRDGNYWLKPKLNYIPAAMLAIAAAREAQQAVQSAAAAVSSCGGPQSAQLAALSAQSLQLVNGAAGSPAAAGKPTRRRTAQVSDSSEEESNDEDAALAEHAQFEEWQSGWGQSDADLKEEPEARVHATRGHKRKARTPREDAAAVAASAVDDEGQEYCSRRAKRQAITNMKKK